MFLKLEMMNQTAEFRKTDKTGEALMKLFWSDAPAKDDGLTKAFRIMVHLA